MNTHDDRKSKEEELKALASVRDKRRNNHPKAPSLIHVNNSSAVWEIAVPYYSNIFMGTQEDRNSDAGSIVFVDTELFYYSWLNSSVIGTASKEQECVLRSLMHKDHDYMGIDNAFKKCNIKYPVSIPTCVLQIKSNAPKISFSGGISQAIWLIANRAEAFPVHVNDEGSKKLFFDHMGIGKGPVCNSCLLSMRIRNAE